jgi:quercetin dioxygenase-like cupin family protein
MRKWQYYIGAFLVMAVAIGMASWQGVQAAEEYVSKARVKTLVQEPLAGVEGKEVVITHFSIPPEFVGGKHMHPASVFVYVLEGELTVESEGETLTFKAGEVYPEPLQKSMVGKNLSASDDLELLVFQIGDVGKPMMVKVE